MRRELHESPPPRLVISCEHAGNQVPSRYLSLFNDYQSLLHTHRGYDAGALGLARHAANALNAPLFFSPISRLLVDVNRSIGHPHLYSEATRPASEAVRHEILKRYYLPYRGKAELWMARAIESGQQLLHVSCHSFTPELDGQRRDADIGLLFDPERMAEAQFCRTWQTLLRQYAPELRCRLNYPYSGSDDGFTTYLRQRFPADRYLGIELEVNQRHAFGDARHWHDLRCQVIAALSRALLAERQPIREPV